MREGLKGQCSELTSGLLVLMSFLMFLVFLILLVILLVLRALLGLLALLAFMAVLLVRVCVAHGYFLRGLEPSNWEMQHSEMKTHV
jgi:hypothetical protein